VSRDITWWEQQDLNLSLLVRQRQHVRQHPRFYVPASQSGIRSSAQPGERPRTTLRGYTTGYISRPVKGDTSKIN
jgi:hypothetical protein